MTLTSYKYYVLIVMITITETNTMFRYLTLG